MQPPITWITWCMIVGMFGQVAYLADILQPVVPAWVAVPIFTIPVALYILVQPGELAERWVRPVHRFAAGWYVVLTVAVELAAFFGHAPQGAWLFRLLMHLGWLQFFPLLTRQ